MKRKSEAKVGARFGDILQATSIDQRAWIGAVALAYNDAEFALHRLTGACLITAMSTYSITSRINGTEGLIAIIRESVKGMALSPVVVNMFEVSIAEQGFPYLKGLRDSVEHSLLFDSGSGVAKAPGKRGKAPQDVLLSPEALAALPPLEIKTSETTGGSATSSSAPVTITLPEVSKFALLAISKESVARELLAAAKRRVMTNPLTKKELSDLMDTVRRAGFADGYAQARADQEKLDAAMGRMAETQENFGHPEVPDNAALKAKGSEVVESQAGKVEEKELYVTRTTVAMVKTIALDYLKSVAPKIVGPTEIIKNSKAKLNVFISFGTLNRAMALLVDTGEIELTERSRWRFKGRTELRSVR